MKKVLFITGLVAGMILAVAIIRSLSLNSQPNYPQPKLIASIPAFVSSLSIEWTPDGQKLAIGQKSGDVTIWNVSGDNSTRSITTLKNDTTSTTTVAWNQDGSVLAAGHYDGIVEVWDTATDQLMRSIEGSSQWISGLILSPSGDKIASSSVQGTVIWDTTTGSQIFSLKDSLIHPVWSPDGDWIISAGFLDPSIHVWEAKSGKVLSNFNSLSSWDRELSPDGKRLALGSAIVDLPTGLPISRCQDCGIVNAVAWNSNGTKLAIGGGEVMCFEGSVYCQRDYGIRIIASIQASNLTPNLLGKHEYSVVALAWHPDGTKLVSASWDDTVRIWDVQTGQLLNTFFGGKINGVSKIALRPDGSMIAMIDDDQHEIHIWDLSAINWISSER